MVSFPCDYAFITPFLNNNRELPPPFTIVRVLRSSFLFYSKVSVALLYLDRPRIYALQTTLVRRTSRFTFRLND